MPTVVITCPHCRYSRPTDSSRIPSGSVRVTCPRCARTFPLPAPAADGSVPPPPNPGTDPARGRRTLRFVFTGNAREYFGIWAINTLLILVTLGIYSPWAKVRKRRYFYGNTLLDGARFDYLADPLALLKGWLIGAALFLLYTFGGKFVPLLAPVLGVAFFFAVPWLIVRSRIFTARNSSHRNIRFGFRPEYGEAYMAFSGLPVLTPFTLGLLFPYVLYRQRRFLVENGTFGRTPFRFEGRPRDFYAVFLKGIGLAVAVGIVAFLTAGGTLPFLAQGRLNMAGLFLPLGLAAAGYFVVAVYAATAVANLTWNGTRLGKHRFASALRTRDMLWIYASNAAAIALSVGLLAPWAAVRLARYRADALTLEASGDLETILAGRQDEVGATGEEIGDIFGLEVGF